MAHDEPCITPEEREKWNDAYDCIRVNHHENGSLMARMNAVELQQEHTRETLDKINQNIERLPKKLLTWLTIIVLLLTIFTFIAPSLRKAMNMPTANMEHHEISQEATIPLLAR